MGEGARLPDRIQPGVRVLFVGINPGLRSAQMGHHFAGSSNRFWKLLYESRLVTEPLTYQEDERLPEWGLGLTNIVGRPSRGIESLSPQEYRGGMTALTRKVRRYRPRIVALLGITIYRIMYGAGLSLPTRIPLGPTSSDIAGVPIFLLPNPSGRNARYCYEDMLAAFRALQSLAGQSAIPDM
ncbi:MAG: mismatch-specific DNA-glycosylase [Nitrospira sp.]|jgi:TDG/mug DNA glycosylase family protein|nr:MAG: mismatch-specific DNA-glycosylase [Nitrospira sp.]